MTVLDQTHSRRRFLQLTGAVGATAALGGVLQACNVIGGGGAATTGTFNWMTWSDHYIQSQLDKIAKDILVCEHKSVRRWDGSIGLYKKYLRDKMVSAGAV